MGKLIRVPNHDSHKSKVVILLLMLIMMKSQALSDEDFIREECLNVPASVFADTLKTTIDVVLKVSSIVAKFGGVFGEFRVSNAISDCLDLLELSSDELSWTLSASQHGTLSLSVPLLFISVFFIY